MNTEFNGRKELFWMGLWYYHNINMKNNASLKFNSLSNIYPWHLNSNFYKRVKNYKCRFILNKDADDFTGPEAY